MQYDKQYAVLLASAAIFFSSEHKRRSSCLLFPQSCSKSRISWSASLQRRFSSSLLILKTHAVHTYIFHIHILTFFSLSQSSPRSSSPPSPPPSAKSPYNPPPAAPLSCISTLGPTRARMLPLWCKSTCSGTVRPRAGFQVLLSYLLRKVLFVPCSYVMS